METGATSNQEEQQQQMTAHTEDGVKPFWRLSVSDYSAVNEHRMQVSLVWDSAPYVSLLGAIEVALVYICAHVADILTGRLFKTMYWW